MLRWRAVSSPGWPNRILLCAVFILLCAVALVVPVLVLCVHGTLVLERAIERHDQRVAWALSAAPDIHKPDTECAKLTLSDWFARRVLVERCAYGLSTAGDGAASPHARAYDSMRSLLMRSWPQAWAFLSLGWWTVPLGLLVVAWWSVSLSRTCARLWVTRAGLLLLLSCVFGGTYLAAMLRDGVAWCMCPLIGVCLYLTAPLLRLYRSLKFDRTLDRTSEYAETLPSRQAVVESLWRSANTKGTSKTVSLFGEWGSGKSTVLDKLQEECRGSRGQRERSQRREAIFINAWRYEGCDNPELKIFEAILNNPELLWPWGWLRIPAWRLAFTNLLHFAPLSFRTQSVDVKMKMQDGYELSPPVKLHGELRRILAYSAEWIGGVYVILDEIDRCSPRTAQSFVTLIRRFLDVPCITVVIAYVPSQLRYKAFNPLQTQLADLGATVEAFLYGVDPRAYMARAVVDLCDAEHTRNAAPLGVGSPRIVIGSGGQQGGPPRPTSLIELQAQRCAYSLVTQHFGSEDTLNPQRERALRSLEQKYVFDHPIELPDMTGEDFVFLLARSSEWAHFVGSVVEAKDKPDGDQWGTSAWMDAAVAAGLPSFADLFRGLWASFQASRRRPGLVFAGTARDAYLMPREVIGSILTALSPGRRQKIEARIRKLAARASSGETPSEWSNEHEVRLCYITAVLWVGLVYACWRMEPSSNESGVR